MLPHHSSSNVSPLAQHLTAYRVLSPISSVDSSVVYLRTGLRIILVQVLLGEFIIQGTLGYGSNDPDWLTG